MWRDVPLCISGAHDCFCCPRASVHRPSIACLAVFLCARGPSPPLDPLLAHMGGTNMLPEARDAPDSQRAERLTKLAYRIFYLINRGPRDAGG